MSEHVHVYADSKYRVRLPGEEGVWFGSRWLPNLVLLEDDERPEIPETVPDEEAWHHRFGCECFVCARPAALWWKRAKVTSPVAPPRGPYATAASAPPDGPRSARP